MEKRQNVLSHLIKSENDTTQLLYALLVYKPFREAIVRLLTKGHFGAADIGWNDISTQTMMGQGIPDLALLSAKVGILIEIKTTPWRGLTGSQPNSYLQWLVDRESMESRFFIALVPPVYYRRKELEARIQLFHDTNTLKPVTTQIVTWDEVLQAITANDLDKMHPYIQDFCALLESWYATPITRFTFEEVRSMYEAHTAAAIRKLIKVVEDVIGGLESKGYTVGRSFNRRWWEGEYGCYVKCNAQVILWFGIWQSYWENRGIPLCFGVHDGVMDARACTEFKTLYPNYIAFSDGHPKPYLLSNIENVMFLSDDPVRNIIGVLEGTIQKLCSQITNAENS